MYLERQCSLCQNTFPATPEYFRIRSRNRGLEKVCKDCWREKLRAYRQIKRQHGEHEINPRRYEIRKQLDEIKLARGCSHCGYNKHPAALDFHHLSEHEKIASVSSLFATLNLQKILAEVKKCEILCANCHRIETFNQKYQTKPEKPVDNTLLTLASQHFKKRKLRNKSIAQINLFETDGREEKL